MKRRTLALILTVLMMVSLLTAYPTAVSAESKTFTVTGDNAMTGEAGDVPLTITYPSQVTVGQEFEVKYTFAPIAFEDIYVVSVLVAGSIDTDHVILSSKSEETWTLENTSISTWTDASAFGANTANQGMQDFNVSKATSDQDPNLTSEVVATVRFTAHTAGTATFAPSSVGETIDIASINYLNLINYLPEEFTIEVVEEGGTPVEPTTYTVIFVDGQGNQIGEAQTVEEGKAATAPADPTREGYDFAGWDVAFDAITADTTVTAKWTVKTFTVTFVDGQGNQVGEAQTVEYGKAATAPADPIRAGWTFDGWDVAFNAITADTTVTAKWTQDKYTVTFVDQDGATVGTDTVTYGEAATAPATDKVGYDFQGWDKDFSNITGDLTVTGTWTIKTFTVTFVDGFGTTVSTQTIEYGKAATDPGAPVVAGQEFKGWDKDFSNITGDLTVTATWAGLSYTVIFQDQNGTELSKQTVNYGGAATAPATDKLGWTFTGWDKDFSNITADLTVTGTWTEDQYTVTFVDQDGATVGTDTVTYGEAATAPATDKVGYNFGGWDKDFSNITGDLTVTGTWTIKTFTVTFVVDGRGTTADQLVWTVDYNTAASAITVPTVVASGAAYEFTGWDKEVPANITEDVTITAQFKTTGSTVSVTFECGANGTIIGIDDTGAEVVGSYTIAVASGTAAGAAFTTPNAIADENYSFIGWFNGDEKYDFNSVLEGDITLTAKFAINAITITGFEMGAVGTMGYANGYLYVNINDADADLSNLSMVTMYHTLDGRTYLTISDPTIVTDANGTYIAMGIAGNNGYEKFDVYLTDGLIDFSAADWNVVDVATGLVIGTNA